MDFRQEAIETLETYEAMQEKASRAEQQIAFLKEESIALRCSAPDRFPITGGTNSREDRLVSIIALQVQLEKEKKIAEKWIKLIEETLASLDGENRRILELLYIRKAKGNVDRLCEELYCEPRTIYRKRDAAIREFTMRFFGVDK